MIATKGSFSLAGSGANEPDRCVVSNLTAKHWYRQKVVINPTIQPLPTAETLEEWVMEISRDYFKKWTKWNPAAANKIRQQGSRKRLILWFDHHKHKLENKYINSIHVFILPLSAFFVILFISNVTAARTVTHYSVFKESVL